MGQSGRITTDCRHGFTVDQASDSRAAMPLHGPPSEVVASVLNSTLPPCRMPELLQLGLPREGQGDQMKRLTEQAGALLVGFQPNS